LVPRYIVSGIWPMLEAPNMRTMMLAACAAAIVATAGVGSPSSREPEAVQAKTMNGIAEGYVKLVLAMGRHDADYVDA
jgi:hypothetical protein